MNDSYNPKRDGKADRVIKYENKIPSSGPVLDEKYMTRHLTATPEEAIQSIQKLLDKRR